MDGGCEVWMGMWEACELLDQCTFAGSPGDLGRCGMFSLGVGRKEQIGGLAKCACCCCMENSKCMFRYGLMREVHGMTCSVSCTAF